MRCSMCNHSDDIKGELGLGAETWDPSNKVFIDPVENLPVCTQCWGSISETLFELQDDEEIKEKTNED